MKCPACKTGMANYEHGSFSIDVCEKCRGIWFDKDELSTFVNELFKEKTPENPRGKPQEKLPAQEESERACPVCNKPMIKFKYGSTSDIALDKCPSCKGIWTDAEEVFAIVDFIKNRRANDKGKKFFSSSTKLASKTQQDLMIFFEGYSRGIYALKRKRLF